MGFNDIVQALYSCLPETPSSSVGSLSAAVSDDRISALPDSLLGNILSRLPVNDAARTAVLSPRWRGLWRSTPLVLEDRHLVIQPAGRRDGFDPSAHAAAVSRVLTSHPGPFRWVHISANTMADQQETLLQWLRLFVAKGVETLVLVNRPWPIDLALPASILRCASLRRLYLGVWKFPDTSRPHVPPRGPGVFPNLQELGICHTIIQDHDIDYLLACSPELKLLALIFSDGFTSRLFISSNSLRCVVLWLSTLEEVDIVAAPRLQRLILECTRTKHIIKVKVGYAPELTVLGYLDTATHVLEIGNTIISARVTNVTPNDMVPSVKVLALKVDFKVTEEVKTLLCFLRCFPHVETLHIMSNKNEVKQQDQRDAGDDGCEQFSPMFWQDVGSIECVESQVKKVVLGQLTAGPNELGFIKFLLGTAQVLKRVVLVLAVTMSPTSADEAMSKLDSQLPSIECASENVQFTVLSCPRAAWSYRRASDVLLSDPFPG